VIPPSYKRVTAYNLNTTIFKDLLQITLEEEKSVDCKLTEIAMPSINEEAANKDYDLVSSNNKSMEDKNSSKSKK
jgi:hypothetical protein